MNETGSRDHAPALLEPLSFSGLSGWLEDDHAAAFSCFRVSARRMLERPYTTKLLGTDSLALAGIAERALALPALSGDAEARAFFEANFEPFHVVPMTGHGHVTAYYEPEVAASRERTERFSHPVMARPVDLVDVDDTNRPPGMDPGYAFARRTSSGLVEYYDRAAIENGALDGQGLELFWLESRIDLFFIHIQGSARLALTDGSATRIGYAAKSGHPFTGIGRLLLDNGDLQPGNVSMQSVRTWLAANPGRADEVMQRNRSYIFFREIDDTDPVLGPVGAASVQLTPGRSLAVDHRLHTFGSPIFVTTKKPLPGGGGPWQRLMIAQDTGSAIVGPARGDLFIGSGMEAGEIAGGVSLPARFVLLRPRTTGTGMP